MPTDVAGDVVLLRRLEHIVFTFLSSLNGEEHDDDAEICERLLLFEIARKTSSRQPTLIMVFAVEDGQDLTDDRFVLVAKGDSDDDEVQYSKLYEAPLLLDEA